MATTKQPTGLTVSRGMASSKDDGVNDLVLFKCEWKQAEDYESQNVWYRKYINHNDSGAKANEWIKRNSGIGDVTSTDGMFYSSDETAHMNEGHPYLYTTNYFPYKNQTIEAFQYVVRGKAEGKDVSDWTWCRYNINLPPEPVITNELIDGLEYTTNFSWTVDANDDDSRIFERFEWQSMLIKSCKEFDGSKLNWSSNQIGWQTGHGDPGETSGQIDNTSSGGSRRGISEEPENIDTSPYSATRWFRVRSVSCRGASKWVYSYHTYAVPNAPTISSASYKENSSNGTMDVTVSWKVDQSGGLRPIDAVEVDYCIGVPQNLSFALPSSPQWEGANVSKDMNGTDTCFFRINKLLSKDECLWVRVLVSHDTNISYSAPKVLSPYGYLNDPSITTITVNQETGRAEVGYENNSSDPNTRIAAVITGKDIDADSGVSKKLSGDRAVYGLVSPTYDSDGNVLTQVPSSGTVEIQIKPSLMKKIVSGSYSFGVVAFTGKDSGIVESAISYSETDDEDETITGTERRWTVKSFIRSSRNIVYENGSIPQPPGNVTVERSETEGEVIVRWEWNKVENGNIIPYYEEADSVIISWADNEHAWESTSQPETYTISRSQPSRWRISGLEMGKTWWFKVAFAVYTSDDEYTMGPWCEVLAFDLTNYPNLPVITGLSKEIMPLTNLGTTVSWTYSDPQNLPQAYFEICSATYDADGNPVYNENNIIKHGTTATSVKLTNNNLLKLGTTNGIYYIAVRVASSRGWMCEGWSKPVAITFAPTIGFSSITVTDTIANGSQYLLKSIPFKVTINTATTCSACFISISREQDYHIDRPDGGERDGYSGEIVATMSKIESSNSYEFVVTKDNLIGYLDDNALYRLTVSIVDEYGQVADNTSKNKFIFRVSWTDKAASPTNSTFIGFKGNALNNYRLIAYLYPKQRDNIVVGTFTNPYDDSDKQPDRVCDIYRLSADGPQLIVENATYNRGYVDPYPAFGKECGYRFVDKRYNGTYVDWSHIAWYDVYNDESNPLYGNGTYLIPKSVVINFGKDIVTLPYNITLSNSWKKDFKQTKYLGGSIQGDWNPAVEMSSDISSAVFVTEDFETTRKMRALGNYPGLCHVRTPDGASFAADVQVSDSKAWDNSKRNLVEFTITVTRVDSVDLEGMTFYDYWNAD